MGSIDDVSCFDDFTYFLQGGRGNWTVNYIETKSYINTMSNSLTRDRGVNT